MCDESTKKPKRYFAEAWLNDDRYKSWIRKVPFDSSLYYCSVCNKNFSCTSTHISRHADSAYHKNNIKANTLLSDNDCNDDVDLSTKKLRKSVFQQKWLNIEQFKCWLREMPHDASLFFCSICQKSIVGGLSHIHRHAKSKVHINMSQKIYDIEVSKSNEDSNVQSNESLLLLDECRKSTEIRYAELIANKNICHQTAKEILSFFQFIGKDPNVLKSMGMGRTKCKNIITKVLYPVEMDRIINKLQNIKFSVFFHETSDTTNKWMIFIVRYVDPETLDIHLQLVKLINIDDQDSSAEKLSQVFKDEMRKLQIPITNIAALSCDNESVMTGKQLLLKKMLEDESHRLLAFSCPCHAAALAAHAACTKIPACCEEFLKNIADYLTSTPTRLNISYELYEYFQETNRKILNLHDTCLLSHYLYIEKFLESWDTIKHSLTETVVSEKTNKEYLLYMMNNVEIKAYFLFLKYILNFFNTFSTFFQTIETRIHLLQPKSENLLLQICRNFIKEKRIKSFSRNILSKGENVFSLKENQKAINEITLGSECETYLVELTLKGHIDTARIIRENCLTFYETAAKEIYKRLAINDIFLSKLQVFRPHVSIFNSNREQSFNDVSVVAKAIGDFDEDALKKEWIELPSEFTIKEKRKFSKLNFDNMWKEILQRADNIDKYSNLRKLLNTIRSFPNSSEDPERMFSILNNLKPKQRKKLSPASINAICVFKSALKTRGETAITMTIDEKHLSLMSSNKLYANDTKGDKNILEHAADDTNVASSSSQIINSVKDN